MLALLSDLVPVLCRVWGMFGLFQDGTRLTDTYGRNDSSHDNYLSRM